MNAPAQRDFASAADPSGPVALRILPAVARFSLRIAPDRLAAASEAFGHSLPQRIGEAVRREGRRALCLGPDEWMLWAEESEASAIERAFAASRAAAPHSLVAISDRELGIGLSGPQAAELLSAGCPIDLEAMAIGSGTRTVFDGVQVVLLREDAETFTLEVWRSFAPHVLTLLETANRELAAGL